MNRSGSSNNIFSNNNVNYRELETTPRSVMFKRDWRTALHTPPTYRIGNRTLRFNYHFALLLIGICSLFVFFYYIRTNSQSSSDAAWLRSSLSSSSFGASNQPYVQSSSYKYDDTYPLTKPKYGKGGTIIYRIGIVADMDKKSKITTKDTIAWQSFLKKGYLFYDKDKMKIKIEWDPGEPTQLLSDYSEKDRGMELSELVTFDGKLLSFDDRTGLIYEIIDHERVLPWVLLLDGDGRKLKGFKSEWATVKDQMLFVGSMGKEWTTSYGKFENNNPMYVKELSPHGTVRHLNWTHIYKIMRLQSRDISWPGYMIHESGVWSNIHKKWFFLPRRCTKEQYNETLDELISCNILITATEDFRDIKTIEINDPNTKPTHGFSSFKFIPETGDRLIVAIKTEELNNMLSTYITIFDINGKILNPEERIDTNLKYEGIEFI